MNINRKFGIGGSTIGAELEKLIPPLTKPEDIPASEYEKRIIQASEAMKKNDVEALYLNAGINLFYFTGTKWNPSERMVGAVLFENREVKYIVPAFEINTFKHYIGISGELISWEEHEDPLEKIIREIQPDSIFELDDSTPYNLVSKFQQFDKIKVRSAEGLIRKIRMFKSKNEISQIQYAMDLTMRVQKAAAAILKPGITAPEVINFIDLAHKKLGIEKGSFFCIVLFGKDTSFPHGVKYPKPLEEGDIVLVDTGCQYNEYISDITRTYSYGKPSRKQERYWNIEKVAQLTAFETSLIGNRCGQVDDEVRRYLKSEGLGLGYNLPGLPHRTGHGIGLEIHENPYILNGNNIEISPGMTYSIEPMLVFPEEFGIRLEDHVHITPEGAKWFTEPAASIDNPFGY